MTQYIEKSALVAEIKRLLAFYSKEIEDNKEDPWAMDIAKRDILQEILSFLNTLEMKEVDLNEEFADFLEKENACVDDNNVISYYNGSSFNHTYDIYHLAKHFFEFGLKAQKGE